MWNDAKQSRANVAEQETDVPLPPRSTVHPSNKMKMVRLFYNSLLALFLLLTAGLMVWGLSVAGFIEVNFSRMHEAVSLFLQSR
jgi:hypothetical protein